MSSEKLASGTAHGVLLTSCFIFFLIVCKLYLDQYIDIRKLEELWKNKRCKLQEQQLKLETMQEEVAFLGTLKGVEKIAREKLKYIKRDEVIIVPVGRN